MFHKHKFRLIGMTSDILCKLMGHRGGYFIELLPHTVAVKGQSHIKVGVVLLLNNSLQSREGSFTHC